MSEIVERASERMWDAARYLPDMPMFAHEHGWADDWPAAFEWMRGMIRSQARAAIEAMREPTNRMQRAGMGPASAQPSMREEDWMTDAINVWQAMIDAALSEETGRAK